MHVMCHLSKLPLVDHVYVNAEVHAYVTSCQRQSLKQQLKPVLFDVSNSLHIPVYCGCCCIRNAESKIKVYRNYDGRLN